MHVIAKFGYVATAAAASRTVSTES